MSLTTTQKRALHHCPGCGHLHASHDTAGCAPCLIEGGSCQVDTSGAMIETTYAAVERLLAMDTAVPPGPCFATAPLPRPLQRMGTRPARCELLAGHDGAHTGSEPWGAGGRATWLTASASSAEDLQARLDAVLELHRPWYEVDGVRHDNTVLAVGDEVPADHVCQVGPGHQQCHVYPDDNPEEIEHEVLACVECRQTTEDGAPGMLFWPCPTVRAVTG